MKIHGAEWRDLGKGPTRQMRGGTAEMRLVIEKSDFRSLSKSTQNELLSVLTGQEVAANGEGKGTAGRKARFRLRQPVDLTPELTTRLMHGLSEIHKERLRLFAEKNGRVTMKELLAHTDGADVRALSHFEGALTRRLRRLLGDTEKVAYLIGWDYDSTVWSDDGSQIDDGVYYVSEKTAHALRHYFDLD